MAQKPLDLSSGMKTCPQCEQTKPVSEFHRSRRTLHGFAVYCKSCSRERHRAYEQKPEWKKRAAKYAREWRKEHPGYQQEYDRKKNYGAPPGMFEQLLAQQNGRCAICKSPNPGGRGSFHIDHCHSKGHIRGLLCHGCNVSIGHFNHDPKILLAAIDYLNQTSR